MISVAEPNAKNVPIVRVVQRSLTSLRIREIRARGCTVSSTKSSELLIGTQKSYQESNLRQIIGVAFESVVDIHGTRQEIRASGEKTVLDQTECRTDARECVSHQHGRAEIFDGL